MQKFLGYAGIFFNDFSSLRINEVEVVVVSGDGPKICGHMLLFAKPFYFHVAAIRDYLYYFRSNEFQRYIAENNKVELFRLKRSLHKTELAKNKLKTLLHKKWIWGVIPNNCADFVEDVVGAGEGDLNLISNCPTKLKSVIHHEIKARQLQSNLHRDRMHWFTLPYEQALSICLGGGVASSFFYVIFDIARRK